MCSNFYLLESGVKSGLIGVKFVLDSPEAHLKCNMFLCYICFSLKSRLKQTQFPVLDPSVLAVMQRFHPTDRKLCNLSNLDISDLLPFKQVYCLLELASRARGVHGGSLQLALSLSRHNWQSRCRTNCSHMQSVHVLWSSSRQNQSRSFFQLHFKCKDPPVTVHSC